MAISTVSYLWRDQDACQGFHTGVSLHSHTCQSKETLDFLANLGNKYPLIRPILARLGAAHWKSLACASIMPPRIGLPR